MDGGGPVLRFSDGEVWEFAARTRVMGILNVTPDSFSDGGRFLEVEAAAAQGLEMVREGADLVDVGGESTQPGSSPVSEEEELRRVVPVIRALASARCISPPAGPLRGEPGDVSRDAGKSGLGPRFRARGRSADSGPPAAGTPPRFRISVDTSKAAVAAAAIEAGADIVNDVTALGGDPAMAPLVARARTPVVLMHMRGTPRTMQEDPRYDDLMASVAGELRDAAARAREAGVRDDRIVLDPGIGFGKTAHHSLEILARLRLLAALGRPVLIGASRKSFLGAAAGLAAGERLEGSLAAGAAAVLNGAAILRVHDVTATVRMVRVIDAIRRAGQTAP